MDIKKTLLLKKLNVIKFFLEINGQEKTLKYMQIKRKTGAYTLYECYMDVIWMVKKRCDRKNEFHAHNHL